MAQPVGQEQLSEETENTTAQILLVDDDPISRDFAFSLLETLGYRVDAVGCGQEAIQALQSVPYRMVLMDVRMPGMDGYEATREIRNAESGVLDHDIPIIAITALTMVGDRESCLEAGMDDYVSKPIEPEELSEVIERHVGRSAVDAAEATAGERISGDEDSIPGDLPPRFDGDRALLGRLVKLFSERVPLQIEALEDALEIRDAGAVQELGHTIKGGAALIGAEVLRDCAYGIEKAGKQRDLSLARMFVDELEREYEKFSTDPES